MLTRTPIPQSVARKIQGMILGGRFKSGERMPAQRELAARLGVSRASLREGLLTLETLGLIKTEAGRGTFVMGKPPSSANEMARWRYSDSYTVLEVFQARIMLEGRIASLAAGGLTEAGFQALDRATDDMERHWKAGDLLANVEADLEFHATIAGACSNTMLVALYETVREQLTETQRQPIPITEPVRMTESIREHRQITSALRSGDASGARKAMERHIRNTGRCAGIPSSAL